MRRLVKFIVAAILCAAMLSTSTAWGRDRYYRSAHPKGDDTSPRVADGGGSSPIVAVMTTTPFGPKLPSIVIVTTQETKATSSNVTRTRIVKHRAAQIRKGNTR